MAPIDIKTIVSLQNTEKWLVRKRLLRNAAVMALCCGAAYFAESRLHVFEAVGRFTGHQPLLPASTLFFMALTCLFGCILLKFFDMRDEISRRRNAEAYAVSLAYHDPLTRLSNRRKFEEYTGKLKGDVCHIVMMLDLDDFKPVNDIFGHATGDQVLIQAGQRIAALSGHGALVARFGGDEFAIVNEEQAGAGSADQLARTISLAFDEPFKVGAIEVHVGISIGVAQFRPSQKSAVEVLREADIALYQAKQHHTAPYCMFEKYIEDKLKRQKLLEGKLRQAIALGIVQPHYQPLVNLRTNEVTGFEALARWNDSELGEIQPMEFIPIAEQSGLITELCDHLLRTACHDAAQWPDHLTLSFNLSPRQFKDKLVGLRILSVLGETKMLPARLVIEITESCLTEDKEQARQMLDALRNTGIKIAIDDFGTGYSSLYHLREFRFDNLKIDRSFINEMMKNSDDKVIVNTILSLSQGLGLMTTAEGIEDEEQVSSLLRSGCQQGQGFLFGRAMPQREALKLIEDGSIEQLAS